MANPVVHFEVLGVDPVDRGERPAEDVVEAAVLSGPLDRDHVGRLLHDADQRPVAALVLADPAPRSLGEVEADLAQADALLHLADRVGEAERLLVVGAEDVEGEPLRGPLADPRQPPELRHQPLDRPRVHAIEASALPGAPPAPCPV